jgi:hypothetical protein
LHLYLLQVVRLHSSLSLTRSHSTILNRLYRTNIYLFIYLYLCMCVCVCVCVEFSWIRILLLVCVVWLRSFVRRLSPDLDMKGSRFPWELLGFSFVLLALQNNLISPIVLIAIRLFSSTVMRVGWFYNKENKI